MVNLATADISRSISPTPSASAGRGSSIFSPTPPMTTRNDWTSGVQAVRVQIVRRIENDPGFKVLRDVGSWSGPSGRRRAGGASGAITKTHRRLQAVIHVAL
jgi:hypothetical protein